MGCEDIDILLYIAKHGFKELESSTLKFANDLKVSQQTISRKLRDLEAKGMIKRSSSPNGVKVAIDEKGINILKGQYLELCRLFMPPNTYFIGIVQKGIGEGRHYVSLPQYQKEFKSKLGFSAYPGTLNLLTNKSEVKLLLNILEPINISGFETKSRTYGSIKCYKSKIKGIDSAIVVPERARHSEEIIEIIAPICLREELNLKDEDKLKVNIR